MGNIIATMIWLGCIWLIAILFLFFGMRWSSSQEPVSIWAQKEKLTRRDLTDVPGYNRAMGNMLKLYSIPYFITGIVFIWSPLIAGILAFLSTLGGVVYLAWMYDKIQQKFRRK